MDGMLVIIAEPGGESLPAACGCAVAEREPSQPSPIQRGRDGVRARRGSRSDCRTTQWRPLS
jgi:hypothetical protein